jgi:hypothetical protein
LGGDRPVAHDRTGDELREVYDVERKRNRRALRRRDTAIDVDEIGNDVEREKRDADRQRDVRAGNLPMPIRVEHDIGVVDDEIEILEDDEDEQVAGDRPADQLTAALGSGRSDRLTEMKIRSDRDQNEDNRDPAAPDIEHDAGEHQNGVVQPLRRTEIDREGDREKQADECQIAEHHRRGSSSQKVASHWRFLPGLSSKGRQKVGGQAARKSSADRRRLRA